MTIHGKTDIGTVRTTNQDTFAFGEPVGSGCFALVCDGMGGENGGNIASQLARDTLIGKITRNMREGMDANSVRNMMLTALSGANSVIFDKGQADPALNGMGTTVELACNLIQIGDHEQQALGGGKGGGQRAGGQGTMDRACGAGLGLHFHDIDAVSKNISTVLVGPFVHMLRHGRGGRDGVNGSDFCKRIRHVAGGRVGVHTLKGSGISHFAAPPFCAAMART